MRTFRLICAILALALMLPGQVVAAETAQGAMGRYVEIPLNAPGEGVMRFAQANGTTYAVDSSGEALFRSADMMTWEQIESGHDEQASPAKDGVNGLMVGEDGAVYLSSGWAMMNDERMPYLERIANGAAQRVQLDRRLETGWDSLTMCVLPSGELLGLSYAEVYRFSPDGAMKQRYAVPGGQSLAAHEGEMAVFSRDKAQISVLDIESGQELRTLALPAAADYGLVGYDAQGALYFVCTEGIYRVNAGGTMFVQIVDGRLTTLGKPSASAMKLLFDAENNPVIAYWDGGSPSLIAYRYDESVPTEPDTVLSVYALYDTYTLKQCATEFQKKYPNVLVEITLALPEGTAITRDDAIRTLNTELLAGKGPDVVVLDGLPVQSYIDKGVLRDLSPVVQPMIDSGELARNLAGSLKQGDEIPAVPTRFLLPTIWGEIEGLKTIEDMANWYQANPDALPAYAVDIEPLIGTFYLSCAPAWFTQDGQLDEGKIEAFLAAMKAIRGNWTYEAFVQKTGWDYKASMKEYGRSIPEWNPYVRPLGYDSMEESWGGDLMWKGMQKHLPYLLRGADSVAIPNGQLAGMNANVFEALPGQAEGCFVPVQMMGASKSGANTELALQFIACALGQEVQDTDVMNGIMEGFPVNAKSLDAMQARTETMFNFSTSSEAGQWGTQWPDQAQRDKLRGMIDALKAPVLADLTLYQMIVDESMPLFEGKIDAAQAAANVCAKANAYLSE